ncbi:hypothetical protein [Spiroplasma endosymbiont of Danaus chrysippus]|uniref:hypothetical protein n=1 Tax=Spiroplasma endosymbiont of Danaus chrysippus TaxID=2691041 RepID=UPI00157B0F1E|nr:hypothetical protein [Spiroplasma endosymbiont of Danaus chrysippus]
MKRKKNKELIDKQIQLMINEVNNFANYETIQIEDILQENQKILSLNDIIDIESEYWVYTVNCVNYNPFNL